MKPKKLHHVFTHVHRDDYQKLLESQNFCCKICGKHASEFKKRLHIDHDHSTGEVRGLLCHACNLGLGYFRDSEWNLHKAIDYLNSDYSGVYLSPSPISYPRKPRDTNGVDYTGEPITGSQADWRRLEDADFENIKKYSVSSLMRMYRIGESTAYQWKARLMGSDGSMSE